MMIKLIAPMEKENARYLQDETDNNGNNAKTHTHARCVLIRLSHKLQIPIHNNINRNAIICTIQCAAMLHLHIQLSVSLSLSLLLTLIGYFACNSSPFPIMR